MPAVLWVFLGAGIGGVTRFLLADWLTRTVHEPLSGFPLGTVAVNVLGSLIIGIIAAFATDERPWLRLFVMVGLLGGFTTFSSFSLDTLQLINHGRIGVALVNVLVSVCTCLLACAVGMWIGGYFGPGGRTVPGSW